MKYLLLTAVYGVLVIAGLVSAWLCFDGGHLWHGVGSLTIATLAYPLYFEFWMRWKLGRDWTD